MKYAYLALVKEYDDPTVLLKAEAGKSHPIGIIDYINKYYFNSAKKWLELLKIDAHSALQYFDELFSKREQEKHYDVERLMALKCWDKYWTDFVDQLLLPYVQEKYDGSHLSFAKIFLQTRELKIIKQYSCQRLYFLLQAKDYEAIISDYYLNSMLSILSADDVSATMNGLLEKHIKQLELQSKEACVSFFNCIDKYLIKSHKEKIFSCYCKTS